MKTLMVLFYTLLLVSFTEVLAFAAPVCFECHEKSEFTAKVVHAPVASGECNVCHNPHVAKFDNLLQKDVVSLCLSCHEIVDSEGDRTKIHQPVRVGNCLACHNPHSSRNDALLKENPIGKNCNQCHADLEIEYKFTHLPFAQGKCTACHAPHQSGNIQLLKTDGDQLCRVCHKGDLKAKHRKFPAAPAACLTCHNPHGSDQTALIRKVLHPPFADRDGCMDCHGQDSMGTELCLECHQEVKQKMQATHNHLTSNGGNACVNCHSPHAADTENLFKNRLHQVCRSCHSDTFAVFVDKEFKHPDALMCANCHDGHGSTDLAMLTNGGVEVCSICHESQGVFTHPVGDTVLDPRTGRSLTCVTCHYPHGTDHKYNLKADPSKDLCVGCHVGYF